MYRMGSVSLRLLALALLSWLVSPAALYRLVPYATPAGCLGGQICDTQPVVSVTDENGVIMTFFSGYLDAEIHSSQGGSTSEIFIGNCTGANPLTDCGLRVHKGSGRVPIINGIAAFTGLQIRRAAADYVLKYSGYFTSGTQPFATTLSNPFTVSVGRPFMLSFYRHIGNAFGGAPMAPNPIVSVVDRGNNIATNVSLTHSVTAFLVQAPMNGTLEPVAGTSVSIVLGLATFEGLFIRLAGYPYQIGFSTDYPLPNPVLRSAVFDVASGPASYLLLEDTSFFHRIRSGEIFPISPRVRIYDGGDNIVAHDSKSQIRVSLLGVKTDETLSPKGGLSVQVVEGAATFSGLSINRPRALYALQFDLYAYSFFPHNYTHTGISVRSPFFSVTSGPPARLALDTPARNAWAGGQPFAVQPVVHVQDDGGSLIDGDFASAVTCLLVPSLAARRYVIVDASLYKVTNNVSAVALNLANGTTYSAGQRVVFTVQFKYDVILNGSAPYLRTSIRNSSSTVAARLSSSDFPRATLQFSYTIVEGDYADSVSYVGTSDALVFAAGSGLVDVNGDPVDASLPAPAPNAIRVNTSAPSIVSVTVDTLDGTYGAGHAILYAVRFSAAVLVVGAPHFLTANLSRSPALYIGMGAEPTTALFRQVIAANESASGLSLQSSSLVFSSGSSVLAFSDDPSTRTDTALSSFAASFAAMHSIYIDTSPPEIDSLFGLVSNSTGVAYAGDSIGICLGLTAAVAISGSSITLALNCGLSSGPCYALIDVDKSRSSLLCFILVVPLKANTSTLGVYDDHSVFVAPECYIRRDSSAPTTAANLSTAPIRGSSLAVALNGLPATVVSVSADIAADAVLYPDHDVLISVNFSSPVEATCAPVFLLNVGTVVRAQYVQGSGTASLLFRYTLETGDSKVGVWYPPHALCADSSCSHYAGCFLYTKSANPNLSVDLTLPSPIRHEDTLVVNATIMPVPPRGTTVLSIVCSHVPGNVSAGEVLDFVVAFTDRVYLNGCLLFLNLNTTSAAAYVRGEGSKELVFRYTALAGDSVAQLVPLPVGATLSSMFCDPDPCVLLNAIGGAVDTTTSSATVLSDVGIDTRQPRVLSVFALSGNARTFTAGDIINIGVRFDRPVTVIGTSPWLSLDLNRGATVFRYASLSDSLSTNDTLVFSILIQPLDFSLNLTCNGTSALNFLNPSSRIFASSSNPTIEVAYELPSSWIEHASGSITVDAVSVPYVTSVTALAQSGRYTVGDSILIQVTFSEKVVANGYSFLNLNVGGKLARALFIGIEASGNSSIRFTPSTNMIYAYAVSEGDQTAALEYADKHSLFTGLTAASGVAFVRRASERPTLPANLALPSPGLPGSISYTSTIVIDGSAPIVSELSIVNADGTYGLNSVISIHMKFSAPVVAIGGPPSLLLNTVPAREAVFVENAASDTLLFQYVPSPGDYAMYLDYASDALSFFNASSSFRYNGARILANSSSPSLPADIHLNPPRGRLVGMRTVTALAGEVFYSNLSISAPGPNYRLYFSLNGSSNARRVYQDVHVSFSSETELKPDPAEPLDHVGASVAMSGSTAIMGAPNTRLKNSVTTEVQTITTSATYSPDTTPDIQLVESRIDGRPAIQQFYTTADVGETVGGFFRIMYGMLGPSRPIPANADPSMLHAFLDFDIPALGDVEATKVPYTYCACENAHVWTLTFKDLQFGEVLPLTIDGSALTGGGVEVIGPTVLQEAANMEGTFTLEAFGLQSVSIPFDAGVSDIVEGVVSLGLSVASVSISSTRPGGARGWTITFGMYPGYIPKLQANFSGLIGSTVVQVWTDKLQNATFSSLSGFFALSWRGNTTALIPYNASAAEVKFALEALPAIDAVNVDKCCVSLAFGATWTVDFIQVLSLTPGGYVFEPTGPLDLMTPVSYLIGIDAQIKVAEARRGTTGEGAGVSYVYEKVNDEWTSTFVLRGNDTSQDDHFGCSVAIDDDLVLIGAKGSSKKGRTEVQTITCLADSGYFQLSFRGWATSPIPWNVSSAMLQDIIRGDSNSDIKPPALNFIEVANWGDEGLCENRTARLSFIKAIFGAGSSSGVELWTAIPSTLSYLNNSANAFISVASVQQQVTRKSSDPLDQGSVYLFRRKHLCSSVTNVTCLNAVWEQEAEFYPFSNVGFELFGFSVAISSSVIAIGCPGVRSSTGSVYIFKLNYNKIGWIFSQELTVPFVVPGDQFGYSLSLHNGTLLVGAPFRREGRGEVFAFRIFGDTEFFILFQDVTLPPALVNKRNDYFGWSVAVHNDRMVIGAKGRDESMVSLGSTANQAATDTGSAYVYARGAYEALFLFLQTLAPSNVRDYDGFGYSVSVYEDVIAVGAVQDFSGVFLPSKAICTIATTGESFKSPITGTFRLEWQGYRTRPLPANVSAVSLKRIIETDLMIGRVNVRRSAMSIATTGYTWLVTFAGLDRALTTVSIDASGLYGSSATAVVALTSPSPDEIRSMTHVFKRDISRSLLFVEEAFLSPYIHQPIDLCGRVVALGESQLLVGCPNRDETYWSSNNTGSAFVYDLGILAFQFSSYSAEVVEGSSLDISVVRRPSSPPTCSSTFNLKTLDRIADEDFQRFIRNLYGIRVQDLKYPETFADASGNTGTANGRRDDVLSSWIEGYYDYKGLSDFKVQELPVSFSSAMAIATIQVPTLDDRILEIPNENFTAVICAPGLWPSTLGKLRSVSLIRDNNNGFFDQTSRTVFDKLYQTKSTFAAGVGTSISLSDSSGLLVTGTPSVPFNAFDHAGQVIVYSRLLGHWTQLSVIRSPDPIANGMFGDSVSLFHRAKDGTAQLAIGEPGANRVYVFLTNSGGKFWQLEKILTFADAYLPQHRIGRTGTLSLKNNILVVGAPAIEKVYIFYRLLLAPPSLWDWSDPIVLQSSDYDYDVLFSVVTPHSQEFGAAVALSSRTLAVGSPYASYDKTGSDQVEVNLNTAGISMKANSKGKVYVFYSAPTVQRIVLSSVIPLQTGTFKLSLAYKGYSELSPELSFSTSASAMKAVLEAFRSIDEVSVRFDRACLSSGDHTYTWVVTFVSEWKTVPLLSASWALKDCLNCTTFDGLFNDTFSSPFDVTYLSTVAEFAQVVDISAKDRRSGDRFGQTLALDGDQLVVGAVHSASATTSSWNFETGSLRGWYATGTAFNYQPTFGDNTKLRAVYRRGANEPPEGRGENCNLEGRYFVGTFEKRPGSALNYIVPDLEYTQGGVQGDEPVGTLTSESFIIRGSLIRLLIGGGCNDQKEYVELLVDGFGVARVTGKCEERMAHVFFNVSAYSNRAAQIRIVDASRLKWGHINVDDIRFDWEVDGALLADGSVQPESGGMIETPLSGAVYMYRRYANHAAATCIDNVGACVWLLENRLTASDKREQDMFGASLSVNDKTGVLVVGAPFSLQYGIYKELRSAYPAQNLSSVQFPIDSHLSNSLQYEGIRSGASASWPFLQLSYDNSTLLRSGAIYVFLRSPASYGPKGELGVPSSWHSTEFAKFQPSDVGVGDSFGAAVAMEGTSLMVGAPGQDASQADSGAVYFLDVALAAVSFAQAVTIVYEGHDDFAKVAVVRNSAVYDGDIYVDYATSDLSAKGVDEPKYQECRAMSSYQRGISGCGDYMLTRGTIFMPRGYNVSGFLVNLIDNECRERFPKYFQLNLYVPGSAVLAGELTSAKVRIDDDDFNGLMC